MVRLLAALALLLPALAWAADPPIGALVSRSALGHEVEQFPSLLATGLEQLQQQGMPLSDARYNELRRALLDAFAPAELRLEIAAALGRRLSAQDATRALGWWESPLGQKVKRMQEEAAAPQSFAAMQAAAGELLRNGERVNKIRRLDDATQASQNAVDILIASQIALTAAYASHPGSLPSVAAIGSDIEKHRVEMEPAVLQNSLTSLLFAYRDLSGAELDEYLVFAESESGKRYYQAARGAFRDATAGITEKLCARLAADARR